MQNIALQPLARRPTMVQAHPPHRSILLALVLLLAAAVPFAAHAERMTPAQLPATLRDWVDWVLFPDRDLNCPFVHDRFDERHCSWPTEIELQLGNDGGRFRQRWSAQDAGWASLPGDVRHWPQDVRIDERPAVVATRDGRPAVRLTPGQHLISGVFAWPRRPESLPIPHDTALLRLSIDEHTITSRSLTTPATCGCAKALHEPAPHRAATTSRCACSGASSTKSRCRS